MNDIIKDIAEQVVNTVIKEVTGGTVSKHDKKRAIDLVTKQLEVDIFAVAPVIVADLQADQLHNSSLTSDLK